MPAVSTVPKTGPISRETTPPTAPSAAMGEMILRLASMVSRRLAAPYILCL